MAKYLTKKQQVFVAHYLVDLDAKSAAIAAGYSEKTAESQGSQLLKNPKVAEEISRKLAPTFKKLDISVERTLNEVGRIAFLDPRKFYRDDGSLKAVPELEDDVAGALAGMDVEEAFEHFGKGQAKPIGELKKIKFWSKVDALTLLMKYHKLLVERVEVKGLEGLAESLAKARARA